MKQFNGQILPSVIVIQISSTMMSSVANLAIECQRAITINENKKLINDHNRVNDSLIPTKSKTEEKNRDYWTMAYCPVFRNLDPFSILKWNLCEHDNFFPIRNMRIYHRSERGFRSLILILH
ncbi:hypothetical protein VNO77_21591 [Canavalia gladiata]|uniref:Uncharacterized protein n=1 Tax=Canavalia gladiata TaxID=3824 RepID=A0AAN9LRN0_CANGL